MKNKIEKESKMKVKIIGVKKEEFIKTLFFLLWQSSKVVGAGVLQDKPEATKEDVWNNILACNDYPGKPHHPKDGLVLDYVFGRCMKFTLRWENDIIVLREKKFHIQYETWQHKYPDNKTILDATSKVLGCTYEVK